MEPLIGMIQPFGFNWAPRNYALCDGQLLAISQNTSLYSLIGTTYGGDGRTSFQLPDLRGRVAVHQGHGAGLSSRKIGSKGGTETNTLIANNLPVHTHATTVNVNTAAGSESSPVGGFISQLANGYSESGTSNANLGGVAGGNNSTTNQAVNNMQPYLVISYCIGTYGIYPSRS